MSFQEIITKYYPTSFIEREKISEILKFIAHKKNPEQALEICLMYKTSTLKHKRVAIQNALGVAKSTYYDVCKECESLKL